jgi:hypothetical protein
MGLRQPPRHRLAIRDRHAEPEPIAAGMPADTANEKALIFPDGQANTDYQTFENIAAWLESLKERSRQCPRQHRVSADKNTDIEAPVTSSRVSVSAGYICGILL